MTAEAPMSERIRQAAGGTSGAAVCRSMKAKTASRAAEVASSVDGASGRPAGGVRVLDRVHQDEKAAHQADSAWEVEPPQAGECAGAVRNGLHGAQSDGDADGHVDEEDGTPPGGTGEQAAEQDPGRDAAAGDRAPDGQGQLALTSAVRRHDDRHGCGGEHRCADALHAAGDHERARVARHAAGQRREREGTETGQEHGAPVEQVREPAAEQQETAAAQHVGADGPLVVAAAEVQVGPDGRQGDVHDADVEHDHELGQQDEDQCGPGTPSVRLRAAVGERDAGCRGADCVGWGRRRERPGSRSCAGSGGS
jgi:hypothetical protein